MGTDASLPHVPVGQSVSTELGAHTLIHNQVGVDQNRSHPSHLPSLTMQRYS